MPDSEVEKLQKELAAAQATIRSLHKRELLLRKQFAFYVEYGSKPWATDVELPKIDDPIEPMEHLRVVDAARCL